MKCIWVWMLPFILFGTVALGQSDLDGSYPKDAPIDFTQAHRLLTADFLDPTSAQYKKMVLVKRSGDGKQYICGWMNAKNSAGGYGPFTPFYIDIASNEAHDGKGYDDEFVGSIIIMTFEFIECAVPLGLPSRD